MATRKIRQRRIEQSDDHKERRHALCKAVGDAVRRFREERGFTQSELAVLCGMTASGYASLEQGRGLPNLLTLIDLAYVLEVNLNDLVPQPKNVQRVEIKRPMW